MTKPIAADTELRKEIKHILGYCAYTDPVWKCEHKDTGDISEIRELDHIMQAIEAEQSKLLAAQRQAILAEVEEKVIGQDETHWTDHWGEEHNSIEIGMRVRNEQRAEQRQALQTLKGEQ